MRTRVLGRFAIASLLAGASAAQSTQVLHTFTGDSLLDRVGWEVARVGDVDGDGRADVLVGSPFDHHAGVRGGSAIVYSGRTGAVLHAFRGTTENEHVGWAVGGAGDVDGDGRPDVVVGAGQSTVGYVKVFSGRTGALLHLVAGFAVDGLGNSGATAGVGDVDRDGKADFAIGEPNYDLSRGRVRIVSGATGSLIRQHEGREHGTFFGTAAAGAGDVNADGWPDVVVGERGSRRPGGWVMVFSGRDGATLREWTGFDEMGYSVDGAGDIDRDGYADVVAGSPRGLDGIGRAFAFSGRTGQLLYTFTPTQPPFSTVFGWSVSGGLDADGDGYPDVLVGGSAVFPYQDEARLFSGRTGEALATLFGTGSFGTAVALLGDADGDGGADFAIGAHMDGSVAEQAGKVRVYGLPLGDRDAPVVVITSPADGAVLGTTSTMLAATIADASATTVASTPAGVAPGALPAGGGAVSGTVPLLVEGTNLLAVSATDARGNVGGASVSVTRDTIRPAVEVVSPAENAVVGASPVAFSITVSDATATRARFGGHSPTLPAGSGSVGGDVALVPGTNAIEVVVTDAAGNETRVTRRVVLDLGAPVVTIDAPADNACFGPLERAIDVRATIEDESATTVRSIPAGVTGLLPPGRNPASGRVELAEGENRIVVEATDATSKVGTASIRVVLDTTAPTASFLVPRAGDWVRDTAVVQVAVDEPLPGSGIARVDLEFDDVLIHQWTAPPYEVAMPTLGRADGAHVLAVLAVDGKGNRSQRATVAFGIDNTPPALAMPTPLVSELVKGTFEIRAVVSDAHSLLQSVRVRAAAAAPTTDASIVYAVPVASDVRSSFEDTRARGDGPLVLTVCAVDVAGNRAELTRTVTVDNTLPEKIVLVPSDGSIVSGIIQIEAAATDANLASIELRVDGVSLGASPTSPFRVPYHTTLRFDGAMTIEAVARDRADNVSSCLVRVTVRNGSLDLTPDTLSLRSQGKTAKLTIEGPQVALLVPASAWRIELLVPGGSLVPADMATASFGDHDNDQIPDVRLDVDRQALVRSIQAGIAAQQIQAGASVDLVVRVRPAAGGTARDLGAAAVRVIDPGR